MSSSANKQVFRPADVEPVELLPGLLVRALAAVDGCSVALVEAPPGKRYEVVHPEWEFVYVLQGQADYDDGRSVKAGEATINLPNMPHPFRTVGDEAMVIIEIKSPAAPAYVELLAPDKMPIDEA
jgi:mannose-6-phosphate isomerase-like protein (cupin superfamily)